VQTALEALQSMNENSPWITLFDRQSKTGKSAHFQVATAQLEKSGLLQIALVAFDLRATSTLTQVLFFKTSAQSAEVKKASAKLAVSMERLNSAKDALAGRVQPFIADYVKNIDI